MKVWLNTHDAGWKISPFVFEKDNTPKCYVIDTVASVKDSNGNMVLVYNTPYLKFEEANVSVRGYLDETYKHIKLYTRDLKTDEISRQDNNTITLPIGNEDNTNKEKHIHFKEPFNFKNDLEIDDAKIYLENLNETDNRSLGTVMFSKVPTADNTLKRFPNSEFIFGGGRSGYTNTAGTPTIGLEYPVSYLPCATKHTHSLNPNAGIDYTNVDLITGNNEKVTNFRPGSYTVKPYGSFAVAGSTGLLNFASKPFWNYAGVDKTDQQNEGYKIRTQIKCPSLMAGNGFIRRVVLQHYRSRMTIFGSLTNTNKYITIELWLKNMGGSPYRGSSQSNRTLHQSQDWPFEGMLGGNGTVSTTPKVAPKESKYQRRIMKRRFLCPAWPQGQAGPASTHVYHYPFNPALEQILQGNPTTNNLGITSSYDPFNPITQNLLSSSHVLSGNLEYYQGDRLQIWCYVYGDVAGVSTNDGNRWGRTSTSLSNDRVTIQFGNGIVERDGGNVAYSNTWRKGISNLTGFNGIAGGIDMEHEELASGTDDIVKLNGDLCAPITAELYAMEHLEVED